MKTAIVVHRKKVNARYVEFGKDEEIQRLDDLAARMQRRKRLIRDDAVEAERIRKRLIRRMRRADGLQ